MDILTAAPPPGILRQWHRSAHLPYVRTCDVAEGTFAHVALIPALLDRWTNEGLDDLDDGVVDWALDLDGVRRNGHPTLERCRAAKLVLDAARELYHLSAFSHAGAWARYRPRHDLSGIDVQVTIETGDYWLALSMRPGARRSHFDVAKVRRGNVCDAALSVVFDTGASDQRCQPYVPTSEQYARVLDELRDLPPRLAL